VGAGRHFCLGCHFSLPFSAVQKAGNCLILIYTTYLLTYLSGERKRHGAKRRHGAKSGDRHEFWF
jgi:hypothetical protein